MKPIARILMGVFLTGVALAPASLAQVPSIGIYWDEALQRRSMESCPWALPGTVVDTLYVVVDGFDMAMASIEYRVDLSPYLVFLMDIVPVGVAEGFSIDGIRITFPTPVGTTPQLLIQKIHFLYMCQGCVAAGTGFVFIDEPITVLPHPQSGKIQAIRWPDMVAVEAEGLISILCPHIGTPTERTTWGNIKALFH